MSSSPVARIDAYVCKKSVYVMLVSMFLIAIALPAWAGSKEKDDETLRNATTVLQQMLSDQNIPSGLIAKADCVVVLPNVKKVGFLIGGTGGRGPMVCRRNSTGRWSAPAMYSIGGVSAGLQAGSSSSDYVLLLMNEKGVNAILSGKAVLGKDATAAAGPSGATAASVGGSDILTYKRSKGLFAGVSLDGASLEPDTDANQRLYGRAISAQEIVQANAVSTPLAAQGMVSLLDSKYAKN